MRASGAVVALVLRVGFDALGLVGDGHGGGEPVVAPLFHLPGLGLAAFEARVGAGIGGAAEADLVPGQGMGVVGVDGVADEQLPEAVDGQVLEGRLVGGLGVGETFEDLVLLEVRKVEEVGGEAGAGFGVDGVNGRGCRRRGPGACPRSGSRRCGC